MAGENGLRQCQKRTAVVPQMHQVPTSRTIAFSPLRFLVRYHSIRSARRSLRVLNLQPSTTFLARIVIYWTCFTALPFADSDRRKSLRRSAVSSCCACCVLVNNPFSMSLSRHNSERSRLLWLLAVSRRRSLDYAGWFGGTCSVRVRPDHGGGLGVNASHELDVRGMGGAAKRVGLCHSYPMPAHHP